MTIKFTFQGIAFSIKCGNYSYQPVKHFTNTNEKSKNFGKEAITELGYFTKLEHAIEGIIKEANGDSEETITLRAYVERLEQAKKEIAATLTGASVIQ